MLAHPQSQKSLETSDILCWHKQGMAIFSYSLAKYKTATKILGTDQVIQLLECCDEHLQKDLTHAAGGNLTNKPEADILAAI